MIDDYFWIVCGLFVGGIGGAFGKLKAKELVAANKLSMREANNFLKGYVLSILIPCLMFWILQSMAGSSTGPDFLTWGEPYKVIAVAILLSLWTTLFVWVFFYRGAHIMERCMPLIGFFPVFLLKEKFIKIGVVLIIASGLWALAQNSI